MSLDETTGKLVPAKIKGLLDMGVKPIYKITTQDGRTIRTTANHPYLTKQGWQKVANLDQGVEIAVSKEKLFVSIGQNSWQGQQNNSQANDSQKKIENHHNNFDLNFNKWRLNSQKNKVEISPATTKIASDLSKIAGKATEANAISAISEQISESLFSWSSENLNAIQSDNIKNDHSLSNESAATDIKFVRITKIELLPAKQVYDIEVEGTHNFVANGIIAHNTYIYGDVGINAVSPAYKLDVNGTVRAVDNVFFNSNTTLGDAITTDVVYINSRIAGSLIPTADNALDLGDGTNWLRWRTGYFSASVGIGGTATSTGSQLTASGAYLINASSTLSINTTGNQPVLFGTGNVNIPYASSTALTVSGSTYLAATNGNVGIGTSSPLAKLSVQGAAGQNIFDVASSTGQSLLTVNNTGQCVTGDTLLSVVANPLNPPPRQAEGETGPLQGGQALTSLFSSLPLPPRRPTRRYRPPAKHQPFVLKYAGQ